MVEFRPEDLTTRLETLKGKPIRISSYKLGDIYHCKAEIDMPGAGARIAEVSDPSRSEGEEKLISIVRNLLKE